MPPSGAKRRDCGGPDQGSPRHEDPRHSPQKQPQAIMQDGRPSRRYRKCWSGERLLAWLPWFGRLVIPCGYHAGNFLAMGQSDCSKIRAGIYKTGCRFQTFQTYFLLTSRGHHQDASAPSFVGAVDIRSF